MEAAWAYQHRPNVTGFLLRRQKSLAMSEEAKQMAWKAQHRLHKRYKAMSARGKNKNQIVTALGRELLGFIWAIATGVEKQQKARPQRLKQTDGSGFPTAEPGTAQGTRKGEPSSCSMRNGLRPQPARLVRGSSRRIMAMRFRPANIRVINRRESSSAVPGSAVGQPGSEPTSRNVFPPEPPVGSVADATTVLAGKGTLRRGKHRRALARCAPFRPATFATGGSGGNTSQGRASQKEKPGSLTRRPG